jgi:hypothetical protein
MNLLHLFFNFAIPVSFFIISKSYQGQIMCKWPICFAVYLRKQVNEEKCLF